MGLGLGLARAGFKVWTWDFGVCVTHTNLVPPLNQVLQLGGRAGTPLQDPAAVLPVPQAEAFRLRGAAPPPAEVARDAVLVEPTPAWALCGPCSASRAPS